MNSSKKSKKSKSLPILSYSDIETAKKNCLGKCKTTLGTLLSQDNLLFSEEIRRDKSKNQIVYIYNLQPEYTIQAKEPSSGRVHRVIHLSLEESSSDDFWTAPVELYWLGVSLTFVESLGQVKLSGVSLRIFKGLTFSDRKNILFRAEWDNPKDEEIKKHAQPHWHVYAEWQYKNEDVGFNLELEDVEIKDFTSDEVEIKDFNELVFTEPQEEVVVSTVNSRNNEEQNFFLDPWKSSSRFHFAMCAKWHLGSSKEKDVYHQEHLKDVEELLNWIKNCIGYIREQLKH